MCQIARHFKYLTPQVTISILHSFHHTDIMRYSFNAIFVLL